ncbi:MAG: hypothetical protein ACOYJR_07510 [Acutalibacteraceae bacterium]
MQERHPGVKANQLRRTGMIPCVICGAGLKESVSGQPPLETVRQMKRSQHAGSRVEIEWKGKVCSAQIKSLEHGVTSGEIIHVNF